MKYEITPPIKGASAVKGNTSVEPESFQGASLAEENLFFHPAWGKAQLSVIRHVPINSLLHPGLSPRNAYIQYHGETYEVKY